MSERDSKRRVGQPPHTQAALEDFVPYLVNRLASAGQSAQNKRLAAAGINTVTLRTLSVLHIQNGLTVNEITARAFAEQSTASRAIDAMVTNGLVERHVSEQDGRRREIGLTEDGSTLLHACWPQMEEHYAVMTAGISEDDLATCKRVLLRMIANLRGVDG